MASNKTKKAKQAAIAALPSVSLNLVVSADPTLRDASNNPLKNLTFGVTTLKGIRYSEGFVDFFNKSNSSVYAGQPVWIVSPFAQFEISRKVLLDELSMIKYFLKNGAALLQDSDARMFDEPILDGNFLGLVGKLYNPSAPQEVKASAASVKRMSTTLTQVQRRATVIATAEVADSALGRLNTLMGNHDAVKAYEDAKALQAQQRRELKNSQKFISI